MITDEKKKRIESLTDSEMEYEINLGRRSRFQREAFAYLQTCYQQSRKETEEHVLLTKKATPLLPFIQERLESTKKEIKDDLFLWLSGKKHPGLEFSGSLYDKYWGPYLDGHVQKIIDTAFTTNKEIATEHHLDPSESVNDGTIAAEQTIKEILNLMADYDRRMRGKGYPLSVPLRDITEFWVKSSKLVRTRAENEFNLLSASKQKIDTTKQTEKAIKADTKSKSYINMTMFLLRHNQTARRTMLSLAAGTVSSWYGIWNLNYDNLVNTGIISIQTKKQLIELAPKIIVVVALIAFLVLNRYFMSKYKDPSKLSDEELDKLLKYL